MTRVGGSRDSISPQVLATQTIVKLALVSHDKVALVPAGSAGKVAYFATILHAHKLKVVALLDSDAAGDQAARQETLVHALGQKSIARTKDAYAGPVVHPEIEDLLRETLIAVAKAELSSGRVGRSYLTSR